jgi:hypothetical protein
MVNPPLVRCLSCQTPLKSNEIAVFRDGVKIAHVRCWRPYYLLKPSHPVDPVGAPQVSISSSDASEPSS